MNRPNPTLLEAKRACWKRQGYARIEVEEVVGAKHELRGRGGIGSVNVWTARQSD